MPNRLSFDVLFLLVDFRGFNEKRSRLELIVHSLEMNPVCLPAVVFQAPSGFQWLQAFIAAGGEKI